MVLQTEDEFFSSLIGPSGVSLSHKAPSSRDSAMKARMSAQTQLSPVQSKQTGDATNPSDFFKNLMVLLF